MHWLSKNRDGMTVLRRKKSNATEPLIDSARAIMIDGAGLVDISEHLLVLLAMTAVLMAVGSYSFRWE
jgi:ABC-type multidrug transport system permease subunit